MKKIISLFIMTLLAMPVSAMNVTTNIWTTEDLNLTNNINASDTHININGVEWKYEPDKWSQDRVGTSKRSVMISFSSILDAILGLSPIRSLSDYEFNVMNKLVQAFITRYEFERTVNILDTRLSAIEKSVEYSMPNSYCKGRVDVMIERNLTSVTCGNTTYYNNDNGNVIGITPRNSH